MLKLNNCDSLMALWSRRLKIKCPKIVYGQGFDGVAYTDINDPKAYKIVLNILRIKSEASLTHVCLHELSHVYLETNKLPKVKTIYWKEYYAEKLALSILKDEYPKIYFKRLITFIKLCKHETKFAKSSIGLAYKRAILGV